MKVKELIDLLKTMPQDAEVFAYSCIEEGDGPVDTARVCHVHDDYRYQMANYYCQGDSEAALYLLDHPDDEVVVIGASIYDEYGD